MRVTVVPDDCRTTVKCSETLQIEAIEAVWWEDLMPECVWRLRVRGLGPLIVGMDAHGGDLYAEVLAEAKRRLAAIDARLGL